LILPANNKSIIQAPTNREGRKKLSKKVILDLIFRRGEISLTNISRTTKIRPGTVNVLVQELTQEKLIRKKGEGRSKGGRKPTLIEIDPTTHFTVGLIAEEKRMSGGIVNLTGAILHRRELSNQDFSTERDYIAAIADMAKELIGTLEDRESVLGVGIGIPGLVDREQGVGVYCNYYDWWRTVPVKSLLEEKLEISCCVENDTRAFTIGEKWFGLGQEIDNFLYVSLGDTIGMGIVIDGQVYRGTGGSAGELGHTVIDRHGPLCKCGNVGCVEAMASGLYLQEAAEKLRLKGVYSAIYEKLSPEEPVSIARIMDALALGDKVANKLIIDAGTSIGIAVSNMVNIFNPRLIILSGYLMDIESPLIETIRNSIRTHCLSKPASEVEVLPSERGIDSGILGASTLITAELFR